ncbi:undecaprenyldiphospho-muramoylpentapeptide beta-N-acetylglucosaminyltransferase [Nonlabens marinus]|uniref:UDP-N-acetylglucosamine--N-acetylmuramyl-(pentapeptide) pyrophosphoryl-undecaprenol N-acetylglucosamine transferase n=1 Tax=Nonlabens marinus S1-08 TaxID=1454201 RepID=W8VP86_9FLAO|nr:undecaprenyldiphospho-muramoylpentapeptide beta-N-acetylglucosaminyltransferase [Nonlabens marinus]BAO54325.1 UDP-N-acetylglucosamine--N-acetylmuramyl-(pentapeptide) pyrophosphoryl-undecaprenol N-acetylglucosamine transferase [Nonlabens marinus S1-08]
MKPYRIIISGGGTGGHIYPAISIANECRRRWSDCEILFVGAQDRMEMEKVPAAGYEIRGLWISGLQRSLSAKNLAFPFKVVKSLLDARKIINDFQPDVAIGTGGYASGPLLYMAHRNRIPTLIQEQNSYPGITNKLLAKSVQKICVASDHMERFFPKNKIELTGNPVRQDLIDIPVNKKDALSHFGLQTDKSRKVLLVLGGSLGARRVNQLIESQLQNLEQDVQILWQCGKLYYEQYKNYNSETVKVLEFVDRMDLAYAAADVIISRAGAGTISELALAGKPVLFIPSPHVAEDHQTKNALAIQDEDAALMIREQELEDNFPVIWKQLISDQPLREKLSANISKLAKPKATIDIVNHIEQLLHA